MSKTIFITVSKGTIVKNILRSGVLAELVKQGHRVVLFFCRVRNSSLPKYLKDEFSSRQVVIEEVEAVSKTLVHRRFVRLCSILVYNKATRLFRYVRGSWPMYRYSLERLIFPLLSKIRVLKRLARYIEKKFFYYGVYDKYFDRYRPDVVFTTSIIGSTDIEFMKEASRRGIKTVSMPRGWDNINTILYQFVPDRLLLQGDLMKDGAWVYQGIPRGKVSVIGFPQFDWYRRPEIIRPREEYCRAKGLDPDKKIILWASSWAPEDQGACQTMIQAIKAGNVLAEPCNLLIRSHFLNPGSHQLDDNVGARIAIDKGFTSSKYFRDNCDPTVGDIINLANALYHADLVITQCSTIVLDAFCYDKPVINVVFKSFYDRKGRDVTRLLYNHDYYIYILDSGATDLAYDERELIQKINRNLAKPAERRLARQEVVRALCHKADGQSSRRLADAIISIVA